MLCKRPTFHDVYLRAFNQPNVALVDTQGRGLDRITETGIVFDGVEYPVDCIIFATGFESGTNYARRAAMEVRGRDGKRMTDHFANGMRSEEHTSELQSLMRISYAVFCLKKKTQKHKTHEQLLVT